jgi:hypothetical protein
MARIKAPFFALTLTLAAGSLAEPASASSTTPASSSASAAGRLRQRRRLQRARVDRESAYFYVLGGTTNDTDAVATVYQIIY